MNERPPRLPVLGAYALSAFLAALAALLVIGLPDVGSSTFESPWWLVVPIAAAFIVAERFLFNVDLRREAISFSLSEVPTVFALAFLGPIEAITIRVISGVVTSIGVERPPAFKIVFNAALYAVEAALAFSVVRTFVEVGSDESGEFMLAAALGMFLAAAVGLVSVCLVISFFEGHILPQLRAAAASTALTAAVGALIGAVSIAPAFIGLQYAWMSMLPIVGAWLLMRRYGVLFQHFRDLRDIHEFSLILGQSLHFDAVADDALTEIGRLTRGGRVTLRLHETRDTAARTWQLGDLIDAEDVSTVDLTTAVEGAEWESFVVPIGSEEGVVGDFAVAGSITRAGRFDRRDVERAVDLAEQLATSLRNGILHTSVERAALHDGLTGEANRTAFETRLAEELHRPDRSDHLAVLVLDLNQFKDVNDTLGHQVGDQVLVEFARRVRKIVADDDLLSRFGGDEFAILVRRPSRDLIRELAERILSTSYSPLTLEACDAVVTTSIGIAFAGDHDADPSGVLRRADIAMYAAKNQRSGIEVYREEIDRRTPARLSLLGDLRSAIERDELEVHYQPKIDLQTSTVIGAEALVRWEYEGRGWITPADFIGVAEESGLVRLVTDVVLTKAIRRARSWFDAGYDLDVSVNISALDLHDESLPERITERLEEHGLDPRRLVVEITESSLMVDTKRTMATIQRLDLLGVRLSLDDFGTGYSSLSHLRHLPVSELKIDRSFVSDLLLNVHDDVIVRSTVDLGHNLGLRVVAEGIENAQVADHLTRLGCDVGQGYGISRPLAPELFGRWLETTVHEVARIPGSATPV